MHSDVVLKKKKKKYKHGLFTWLLENVCLFLYLSKSRSLHVLLRWLKCINIFQMNVQPQRNFFASCILLQAKLLDLSSSFSFILKFTPGSKTKQTKRKKLGKDWFIPVIYFALLKILCVPLYNLYSVFLPQRLPPIWGYEF